MKSVVTRPMLLLTLVASVSANGGAKAYAETIFNGLTWVRVGDPGNMADSSTGFGAVASSFWVGQHKVTNQQYTTFLNAVAKTGDPYSLYNTDMAGPQPGRQSGNGGIARMGSDGDWSYSVLDGAANKPVCYVSYYDAVRMANWLHNGATVGADTEAGAYEIAVNGSVTTVGLRENGAKFFVPSEDEWYKSAYYKGQEGGGYWAYTTQSDVAPVAESAPGGAHSGNFYSTVTGFSAHPGVVDKASMDWDLNYLTEVGAYASSVGPYGTYDQGGLLWEWNDAVIAAGEPNIRGLRGGSWFYESTVYAKSDFRLSTIPETWENMATGFRLAANVTVVPEPPFVVHVAMALLLIGTTWCRGRVLVPSNLESQQPIHSSV